MRRDVLKKLPKTRLQKKISTLKINIGLEVFMGLLSLLIFLYDNINNLTIEALTNFKNNIQLLTFIGMMIIAFFHRKELEKLKQELLKRD